MICISINQESRRLALVDMLNAARRGDLLEVRLDRFGKSPELGELLARKPKPVIMTCRRPQDGGSWEGTEQERLAILRQCIISKADYVEIELDVADDIRPYPPSQRVISYTNVSETPHDLLDIYEEAKTKRPDVIKLVTLARTPEEAWPLVQIMARATVPTVVVGLGRPGVMLSVLGKKVGAPWTYAALERGMEAYPGQPTIGDLEDVYHFPSLGKGTRFVGVTGFGEREQATAAALNAAFAREQLPFRCLPLGVGDLRVFRKVMDAVRLGAAVIDPEHQADIVKIGVELHGDAKTTQAADVLLHKNDAWHGLHTTAQSWIGAIKEKLPPRPGKDNALQDRIAVIVGINATARLLASEIQRQGGGAVLASHLKKGGMQAAQAVGCRAILMDAIYTTMHDALIIADDERAEAVRVGAKVDIHPGYLRAGMVVMDLTCGARPSVLLREAEARRCQVVKPFDLLLSQLEQQGRALTGKPVPRDVLAAAIPERFRDEE